MSISSSPGGWKSFPLPSQPCQLWGRPGLESPESWSLLQGRGCADPLHIPEALALGAAARLGCRGQKPPPFLLVIRCGHHLPLPEHWRWNTELSRGLTGDCFFPLSFPSIHRACLFVSGLGCACFSGSEGPLHMLSLGGATEPEHPLPSPARGQDSATHCARWSLSPEIRVRPWGGCGGG